VAGNPLVELQVTDDMWRDFRLFVPITYLCLGLLLLVCFRSFGAVWVPLLVVSACVGFLVGLAGLMNITLNSVTEGLPSLILCIAVLDVVHIMNVYRLHLSSGLHLEDALKTAIQANLRPCFLTSITTAVGFASLYVSEVVPVKQFGVLAACATLAAYPICFMTLPYFLSLLPSQSLVSSSKERKYLSVFFNQLQHIYKRKWLMIVLIVLTAIVSIVGIRQIYSETMFINFLDQRTWIRQSADYIENNLAGVTPLEISIQAPEDDGIKEPRVLKQIEKLQNYMLGLPQVDKTVSMVQFIKEMHQAMNNEDPDYYEIPDSRNLIAQYILTYSFSGRDNDMDDFVDYTYRTARVRARVSERRSVEIKKLVKQIESFAAKNFDPSLKVKVTSYTIIQMDMMGKLIRGQLKGLAIGFVFMTLMFSLTNRSLFVGLLSLIPNIIPLLAAAGLMGYCAISLNAGSAMTACIAFGIVVDDTIYFLHHARESLKQERDLPLALKRIFETVGPALLYSSLLLTVGFSILMFGTSYFTAMFGMLCAFTIACACLCDLLIMPFLVQHVRRFREDLKSS